MSLAFHTVVLGWLALFSPVRIINLDRIKAEFTAGTARIREVMEEVRERQADRLADSVRSLQEVQRELAELEAMKATQFLQFSVEFAQEAPGLAEQAQAAAAQAQAEAQVMQAGAQTNLDRARPTWSADDFKAVAGTQKKALDAQGRAGQAMERALQALTMSDAGFGQVRQAQADAGELQRRAEQAQNKANSVREEAQWPHEHVASSQREAERGVESRTRAEMELASGKTNLFTASNELAQAGADSRQAATNAITARAEADALKAAAAQAKAGYDKLDVKDPNKKSTKEASATAQKKASDARNLANSTEGKARSARDKVESAKRRVERALSTVQQAEQRLTQARGRLEQANAEVEQARAKAASVDKQMVETQSIAETLQAEARLAQAKARRTLALARQNFTPSGLVSNDFASFAWTNEMPNVYGMDLAELYQTAVDTETRLTESYKRIRAAELAMLRRIPIQRALELTDVARAVRPNLKPMLQATANGGDDVPAMREAVENAGAEISAMVVLGHSMLSLAQGLEGGSAGAEGANVSMEWLRDKSAQADAMEGLAAEDDAERAKDLSGAMKNALASAGGNAAGAGASAGEGQGLGTGPAGGGGRPAVAGGRGGWGFGGPPAFPKKFDALPGRKIRAGATPSDWMYIDSWYIIGPFDNAGRVNIEKKFPPETVVDLNAAYSGKRDRPVKWEFHQAPEAKVTPPFDSYNPGQRGTLRPDDFAARDIEYIIYYAYTELWFDRECDLWVAIGSDDYSKVWIEDQLIWASGKQQKSWRVDEGLRKVHFKKGLNRVLYRVENGWRGTDFSLVICLK